MLDDFSNFCEAMERVEADLENESPHNVKDGYIYSELANAAFGKIKLFRSRGFSYTQICRAFEKNGLLPKKSNPYSLRAAFHRERNRLNQEEDINELLNQKLDFRISTF